MKRNRYNPKGLRRNHRGELLDKWGRKMEVDWDEFEKKRLKPGDKLQYPKVLNPMHAAATPVKEAQRIVDEMLDVVDRMPFPEQLKIGARVRVHTTVSEIVSGGQTGVIVDLPEPGWAEVQFDAPQETNTYPLRLSELEVLP